MESKTFDWLVQNGCELQRPSIQLFAAVYAASAGNPCNGCNCKQTCPAWKKIQGEVRVVTSKPKSHPDQPVCPKCQSPLNMKKVERRGGKCACGQGVK